MAAPFCFLYQQCAQCADQQGIHQEFYVPIEYETANDTERAVYYKRDIPPNQKPCQHGEKPEGYQREILYVCHRAQKDHHAGIDGKQHEPLIPAQHLSAASPEEIEDNAREQQCYQQEAPQKRERAVLVIC